jgi:integrase
VTGTIRERSPGHFELRAFNVATGKQVTRTYVHPRGERGVGIRAARAELARLVTDVANGAHGGEKATLGQLLDEWIRFSEKARERSPTTIAGYRGKVKRIKAGKLGQAGVAKLTGKDLDDFYLELKLEGLSPSSVHHYHRVLRAALNQGVKWGWLQANVAAKATVPSAPAPEMHVPSIEQARALVVRAGETASPDLGPILLFAMLTGVRRGELCGIQWSDIDWAGQLVTIRRSIWQVRSTWGVKDPKTHQVRTVALDDVGMTLLRARRERAELDAMMAGIELSDDAYVWSAQPDGRTPRTPNSLSRAFHRLCRTMEAEAKTADPPRTESWDFRLHDLRHWSAIQLVALGKDPRTVASRLGHSDPAITLRTYSHALEARDRDAAEALGRTLSPPSP